MRIYQVWYTNEYGAFNLWESSKRRAKQRRAELVAQGYASSKNATSITLHEVPATKHGLLSMLNAHADAANA